MRECQEFDFKLEGMEQHVLQTYFIRQKQFKQDSLRLVTHSPPHDWQLTKRCVLRHPAIWGEDNIYTPSVQTPESERNSPRLQGGQASDNRTHRVNHSHIPQWSLAFYVSSEVKLYSFYPYCPARHYNSISVTWEVFIYSLLLKWKTKQDFYIFTLWWKAVFPCFFFHASIAFLLSG